MAKRPGTPHCFTVAQANAMLPLVRAIVGDIVRLARELVDRQQRLQNLMVDRPERDASDPYVDELQQVGAQLERDERQLGEYVKELQDLGVELKGPLEGLVDFPTVIDGKPALLCWKYDEPEVLFWHDLVSGFAGRQPLTADACSHPDESQGLDRLA